MNAEFPCKTEDGGCGAKANEPCEAWCARAARAREQVLSTLAAPPAEPRSKLYFARLYRFPTEINREMPLVWASCPINEDLLKPQTSHSESSIVLNPRLGNSATYYRMNIINPQHDASPGWLTMRVRVEIDMQMLGDGVWEYPLSVFDAAATDIDTGLVRFPPTPVWDYRSHVDPVEGIVWMLGLRRAM